MTEKQRLALAAGRKAGAAAGGRAAMAKAAPETCETCAIQGYSRWSQHLGHLGFAAVMLDNPTALHSLEGKIRLRDWVVRGVVVRKGRPWRKRG